MFTSISYKALLMHRLKHKYRMPVGKSLKFEKNVPLINCFKPIANITNYYDVLIMPFNHCQNVPIRRTHFWILSEQYSPILPIWPVWTIRNPAINVIIWANRQLKIQNWNVPNHFYFHWSIFGIKLKLKTIINSAPIRLKNLETLIWFLQSKPNPKLWFDIND